MKLCNSRPQIVEQNLHQRFTAQLVNIAKNILQTETVRHSGVRGRDGAHAAHRRRTYDAYPGTAWLTDLSVLALWLSASVFD